MTRPAHPGSVARFLWLSLVWCCVLGVSGCTAAAPTSNSINPPDAEERHEISFTSADGTMLAGELTHPARQPPHALVVIIHHAGPVDRTSYAYLVHLLTPAGYAVFTFDKRGNGASAGVYGCCEAADALAAYSAAVDHPTVRNLPVIIVAQSLGTRYVAEHFAALQAIRPPVAVALLSNLLGPTEIIALEVPIIVLVAASEPALDQIGPAAVAAHQATWPYGAELYIAHNAEHTLFDIRAGPIDWDDQQWAERYHRGAFNRLLEWLAQQQEAYREAGIPRHPALHVSAYQHQCHVCAKRGMQRIFGRT